MSSKRTARHLILSLLAASPVSAQPLDRASERGAWPEAVHVEGGYVWDLSAPAFGTERARWFGGGLADLVLGYERETERGRVLVQIDGQWHHGADPSVVAGDAQAYSNMAAEGFERVAECFAEYTDRSDRLRVKVGKIDANTEFAATDRGGEFVNSSFGFSPSISAMPTYPENGLGALAEVHVRARALRVGAFDAGERSDTRAFAASFDHVVWFAQLDRSWNARGGGRVGLGAWRSTAPAERPEGDFADGTEGVYLTLDQTLWMPEPASADRGVAAVLQWARTDGATAAIDDHLALGLVWSGPSARRAQDRAGVAFTRVGFSRAWNAAGDPDENVLEFYYRAQWSDAFAVQPDLQWILDPGTASGSEAVLAPTLRLIASF